jgi:hypothetical protein
VEAGPGRALGRSQVRFAKSDGSIVTGDMKVMFEFARKDARVPFPVMFSYEFENVDLRKMPLQMRVRGVTRAVPTPRYRPVGQTQEIVEIIEFDEEQ